MPLLIELPDGEWFDEEKSEFVITKSVKFQIEHSLLSLSKWESKWKKPLLVKTPKTKEEQLDYIRCMTITQNVNPEVYETLPDSILIKINEYIEDSMTATWFSDNKDPKNSREIITAEIIYYQMIGQNIPMECQKWHLNRLLTLIRVCSIKSAQQNPKKTPGSRRDMLSSRAALNQARKKKLQTKG